MRAAVLYETAKPLVVESDIKMPNLSDFHVLVKVGYSGICRSQLMEVKGGRGEDKYLPHLLGHEAAGIVEAVGARVSKVKVGQNVILSWLKGEGGESPGAIYTKGEAKINSGA